MPLFVNFINHNSIEILRSTGIEEVLLMFDATFGFFFEYIDKCFFIVYTLIKLL